METKRGQSTSETSNPAPASNAQPTTANNSAQSTHPIVEPKKSSNSESSTWISKADVKKLDIEVIEKILAGCDLALTRNSSPDYKVGWIRKMYAELKIPEAEQTTLELSALSSQHILDEETEKQITTVIRDLQGKLEQKLTQEKAELEKLLGGAPQTILETSSTQPTASSPPITETTITASSPVIHSAATQAAEAKVAKNVLSSKAKEQENILRSKAVNSSTVIGKNDNNPSIKIGEEGDPNAEIGGNNLPPTLPTLNPNVKSLDQNGHDWFAAFIAALQAAGAINREFGKRKGDHKKVKYEAALAILKLPPEQREKLKSIDWEAERKKPPLSDMKYPHTDTVDIDRQNEYIKTFLIGAETYKKELNKGLIQSKIARWGSRGAKKDFLNALAAESQAEREKMHSTLNKAIVDTRSQKAQFYGVPLYRRPVATISNEVKKVILKHAQKKLDIIAGRAGLSPQELRALAKNKVNEKIASLEQQKEKLKANPKATKKIEKEIEKLQKSVATLDSLSKLEMEGRELRDSAKGKVQEKIATLEEKKKQLPDTNQKEIKKTEAEIKNLQKSTKTLETVKLQKVIKTLGKLSEEPNETTMPTPKPSKVITPEFEQEKQKGLSLKGLIKSKLKPKPKKKEEEQETLQQQKPRGPGH